MTAGTLRHHLQPGDRSGRDRWLQKDARVPSLLRNRAPLGNRDPQRWAQLEGRGLFPGQPEGAGAQSWARVFRHGEGLCTTASLVWGK